MTWPIVTSDPVRWQTTIQTTIAFRKFRLSAMFPNASCHSSLSSLFLQGLVWTSWLQYTFRANIHHGDAILHAATVGANPSWTDIACAGGGRARRSRERGRARRRHKTVLNAACHLEVRDDLVLVRLLLCCLRDGGLREGATYSQAQGCRRRRGINTRISGCTL